jgi:pilus assembly protein Flp/PilA
MWKYRQFAEVNFGASNACYDSGSFGGKSIEAGHYTATCGARSRDMKNLVTRFAKDESGATAIEYGLIAALISVVIIGVLTTIGTNLTTKFQDIATNLE